MKGRRRFLRQLARVLEGAGGVAMSGAPWAKHRTTGGSGADVDVTLFLCGDVMLGRGLDQIMPHPSDPTLHEEFVDDARRYLELAEAESGPVPRNVAPQYVWGDALDELRRRRPDVRIANLETAVTRSDAAWPGKGIHYRMHPRNAGVLAAAGIDACSLANNHVLDWGYDGLTETLATLHGLGIRVAGAGGSQAAARAPAVLSLAHGRRVLLFAAATGDAGVPESWAAGAAKAGLQRLPDLSSATVERIADDVARHRHEDDVVVFSVHWGSNWGHEIPPAQRAFAHALVDEAGVDVVHGHSSHHPRAIEVHRGHLVLYGCGDFLNDYEGIGGYPQFRGELGLMYLPRVRSADGRLQALALVPTRVRRMRVERAGDDDRSWLLAMLQRECRRMDCDVVAAQDGTFSLQW